MTENAHPKKKDLKPAQVLVIGFALVILIGAILLTLPISSANGESLGLVDAIFTATSAVCVTGLVVVDTGTYFSLFGQMIILLLIQVGGLGFMTMATLIALLIGKRISLKNRLVIQESLGQSQNSGVIRITIYIIYFTFIIEALGAFLLSLRFIPIYGQTKGIYFSIFHSVSAFCNAGFDIIGGYRSLTPFVEDPLISITIMVLIVIGGLGFSVIFDVVKSRNIKKLSLNSKIVLTITAVLLLVGFIVIFVVEYQNPDTLGRLSLKGKVLSSAFQSVTTRTAGFNSLPFDKLHMPTLIVMIFLMFIGGSPSSTAGGIKTTTFGLVILAIFAVIRGKQESVIFKRRVSRDSTMRALAILGIAFSIILVMLLVLSTTESQTDFMDILFEVVSAFATVGLSLGITSDLSTLGKIAISLTMFMGRVGVLTFVFAIANRQQITKTVIHYPEGKIIV